MKAPYGGEGPDYLGLNLKLSTLDNKHAGFINDKIVENPKPAVAYKSETYPCCRSWYLRYYGT